MCGIVGIINRNGSVSPEMLDRVTRSLAHRGPDDSGTVILPEAGSEIGLGNRRLAILDLSPAGHQPMHDPNTGNWIVYNGEIYNFREIRQKLEKQGVQFRSQSDTEVVFKAYGFWGEECLQHFRGMFAFAIWDARQHRLFLARDPMGIKPLYYGSFGDHFVFASEVRTLLDTGLVPRRLDQAGLTDYLMFGSLNDPLTLVEGVFNLRPGHYLVWERGSVREVEYWDLVSQCTTSSSSVHSDSDRKRLKDDLYASLDEAVRLQMVSDVPVGVFLSGGIDSSAITALLTRAGFHLDTFSIVFREADYSEADYSRLVAKKFATTHHEILVSQQDALQSLPVALAAMDLPTIDGINTYLVSQQTRAAGVKVALSGLGGDELFGGYSSFQSVVRMEHFARAWRHVPGRNILAGALSRFARASDKSRKLVALLQADNGLDPYFLSRALFLPQQSSELLSVHSAEVQTRAWAASVQNVERCAPLDPINRVSYLESRCYMLNTLLRDSDAMSMAHGLEIRVPLLDHRVAEKLFHLPGKWKIDKRTPKPLLVGSVTGLLPDEIVHRPKHGFTLPFEHWLKQELRDMIEQSLKNSDRGPLAALLNSAAVLNVWQDFLAGETSWSRPWSLYVLQNWCELNSVA